MDVEKCLLNSGTVPDESRPAVFGIVLFFSVIGVVTNLFLLLVFCIRWESLFRFQSYTSFVINMNVSGLLYSTTNLWISAPCILNKCSFISSDIAMIVLATPNTLAHWSYLLSSLSFAAYRFIIFISKNFCERSSCIKILLISPWLIALLLTFGSVILGCYKRYNRFALSYTYNCSHCDIFFGVSYIDVNFYAGQGIPLLMIAAYLFILGSIYKNRRANAHHHNNRQMLFDAKLASQFFTICCSQYLTAFIFYSVPKMSSGTVWGAVILNCIGAINVSTNPIILLLCNQEIRGNALAFICCKHDIKRTTRITTSRTVVI